MEADKKQLALEKKFVERKLYQKPPITNEIEVLGIQRDNLSLPEYKAAMREVEELEQQAETLDSQNEALEKQNDDLAQRTSELAAQAQEM